VIVLDIGLPDLDGREVCRAIRRRGIATPIVVVTAAGSDADAILSLESGADDYVSKPFRFGVLLARLRALLRRHEHSDLVEYTLGTITFSPRSRRLVDHATGRHGRLTDKESAVLHFLCRAKNRLVDRETLLAEVWGYRDGVDTHTLETHIYRLRRKIEEDPGNPRLLVTEGNGYRLYFEAGSTAGAASPPSRSDKFS
jgi:DNA-binding response OmpR family regulator